MKNHIKMEMARKAEKSHICKVLSNHKDSGIYQKLGGPVPTLVIPQ